MHEMNTPTDYEIESDKIITQHLRKANISGNLWTNWLECTRKFKSTLI